jgi:hypothetical protein
LQTIKYEKKAVLTYVNGDVVRGYAEVADAFILKLSLNKQKKGKVESVVSDDL